MNHYHARIVAEIRRLRGAMTHDTNLLKTEDRDALITFSRRAAEPEPADDSPELREARTNASKAFWGAIAALPAPPKE